MAKKTKMELNMTGTGIKSTAKDVKKTRQETDKLDKSQKNLSKGTNKYHKLQKGVAQAGANSTKNFSKMNQSMGGSSGLVAAYATLAANVFAATAAFGALSRAAEFENLKKGLTELGAQSGRTLSIMAEGLREVTGGAISAEEAMRGAALGVSGGFGGEQLEGLAKIAKGASIALGRNLPDAFDRLTRGAIKLEPEILDELGIMVRLDDAVENYAAEIGKSAGALTQFERRQAFMNAILTQGEEKFGEIAEAVDTDPYAKLGATFGDLTKDIFTFVNETLYLGKIMGFLADNTAILLGVMVLFGSTIAAKMLPFLSDSAASAANAAKGMADTAVAAEDAVKTQKEFAQATIGATKGGSKAYQGMAKSVREGKYEITSLKTMQGSLNKSTAALQSLEDRNAVKDAAAHKVKVANIKTEQRNLQILIGLETERAAVSATAAIATARSNQALANVAIVNAYAQGNANLWTTLKGVKGGAQALAKELNTISATQMGLTTETLPGGTKAMNKMKAGVFQLGTAFRALGKAILKAWMPLGLIIIAVAAAVAIFRHLYHTKEAEAYNKTLEDMDTVLADINKKAEKFKDSMTMADAAFSQIRAFEVTSGLITETNDLVQKGMKERIAVQNSLTKGVEEELTGHLSVEAARNRINRLLSGNKGLGKTPEELAMGDNQYGYFAPKRRSQQAGLARGDLAVDFGVKEFAKKDEGLTHLFAIKESPEYAGMQNIMQSEIPGMANLLKKKMKNIMKEPFVDGVDSAAQFSRAIKEVQVTFGGIGPAVTNMRTSLRESEKEASKFMQAFQKKTKVDAIVDSFVAIERNAKEISREVNKAFGDEADASVIALGKSLSDVGTITAQMIGPEFVKAQRELQDVQKQISETGAVDQQGADWDALVAKQKASAKALGGMFKDFKKISKEMQLHQRLEIQKKKILKLTSNILKKVNKEYKSSTALSKVALQIEKQRAKFEIQSIQLETQSVKNTFKGLKFKEQFVDSLGKAWYLHGKINAEQILELDNIEDQIGMTQALGKEAGDLFALRDMALKQAIAGEELLHLKAVEKDASLVREIEAKQQINKLTEDLRLKQEAISKTQKLIEKFQATGRTELNAAEEAKIEVEAAKSAAEFARNNLVLEKDLLMAKGRIQIKEFELMNKRIELTNAELKARDPAASQIELINIDQVERDINKATAKSIELAEAVVVGLEQGVTVAIMNGIKNVREAMTSGDLGFGEGTETIGKLVTEDNKGPTGKGGGKDGAELSIGERLQSAGAIVDTFAAKLATISPEGAAYAAMGQGMMGMAQGLADFAEKGATSAQKLDAVSNIMGSIGDVMNAASASAVAGIDQQIAAEEKRDGKSKESLNKIKQLQMKKWLMEKKAFDQNKKVKIAQALISTYTGVAAGIEKGAPWGYIEAAITLAMGMAQVKAIQNTKFAGAKPGGTGLNAPNTALNIGKRDNKVDVSRGVSGGELSYLRGGRGQGSGPNDFKPAGGAVGLRQGYNTGGVLIGEQGPEVVYPTTPITVNPNNSATGSTSVNFTINTIDSQGVAEFLDTNSGAIIQTIRGAANGYGTGFLEEVDTTVLAPGG
jgi:hypothetical protein